MSRALDLAYRLQRQVWQLFRPRTRGVKVMLFNDRGEILLIRNNYGRSDQFVLPGGGVRPWETPSAAARREVQEELGCDAHDLRPMSTHWSDAEGKRDTIFLFSAIAAASARPDGIEVAEASFFALGQLPPNVSPATLRRIAEHSGDQSMDGPW